MGLVAHLTKRGKVLQGSELFGKAFEHFIYMKLMAYSYYSEKFYPINYWGTAGDCEVDFILDDVDVAIEVKSATNINNRHLKNLRSYKDEGYNSRNIMISLDKNKRFTTEKIEIFPRKIFLQMLWNGEII